MQGDETQSACTETGIRILLSLLFLLIAEMVRTVLVVTIVFEVVWTLITKQPPNERVRRFANRALSYQYRLFRYLTYNDFARPFPSRISPEVEPVGHWPGDAAPPGGPMRPHTV